MKKLILSLITYFEEAIIQSHDNDDVRLGKRIFVLIHLLGIPFALIGIVQGRVSGSDGIIAIASTFGIVFPLNLLVLRRTKLFSIHLSIAVFQLMLVAFFWGLINGGFKVNFSIYMMPLLPLMLIFLVYDQRRTALWFLSLASITVLFSIIDPYVENPASVPPNVVFDNTYTVVSISTMVFLTINYYRHKKNLALELLDRERERSESLLLNILPKKIADTLKTEKGIIADHHESASILFADLVDFTPMSAQMSPAEMIELLNTIYTHFDTLADKYGVEKIRTIGDNYMVASGVPSPREDHAQALAHMALDMLDFSKVISDRLAAPIHFRIGINSGPMVAGVIGQKKFHYDVWGDTVNTASRMESHGMAGRIQITTHTQALIHREFICEKQGVLDIKGKGEMETWFLVDRRAKQEVLGSTPPETPR